MKLTHVMIGLLLATGAPLPAGVPSQDVQIGAPAPKSSPSLQDKDRGSAPSGPQMDGSRRGRLEDTVQILGVAEQKPDADGRRVVTVRVRYVLVQYPKGVLSLGFNLKSATRFIRVTDKPVMAGSGEMELTATIVPVTWTDAQPFKLYVCLMAEPHPGRWSMLASMTQPMKRTATPVAAQR